MSKMFDSPEFDSLYEVVGVAPEPFTGTEPGTVVDLFVPTMMNPAVVRDDSTWFRTLLRLNPGVSAEVVRQKLDAVSLEFERERSKGFTGMPQQSIDNWLKQKVLLAPAAAGVSGMQEDYGKSLAVLAVLVALVLMIACANVANLLLDRYPDAGVTADDILDMVIAPVIYRVIFLPWTLDDSTAEHLVARLFR